jgi:hypothetical protein
MQFALRLALFNKVHVGDVPAAGLASLTYSEDPGGKPRARMLRKMSMAVAVVPVAVCAHLLFRLA